MKDPSLALVTGASSGIGRELARELARRGYDLLLTADEPLDPLTQELAGTGVHLVSVEADLRGHDGVEKLYAATEAAGRPLALAALNAGIGRGGGTFTQTPLDDHLDVVRLNVLGTVHLAKLVLDDMVAADRGRVLITSSIVTAMPGPYQVTYNASKSFLRSFTEGLQYELRRSGVTLTSLLPGPTDTAFFDRASMPNTVLARMPKDDPAVVARQAIDGLLAGRRTVVGGSAFSKASHVLNALLPDGTKARLQALLSKPDSQAGR